MPAGPTVAYRTRPGTRARSAVHVPQLRAEDPSVAIAETSNGAIVSTAGSDVESAEADLAEAEADQKHRIAPLAQAVISLILSNRVVEDPPHGVEAKKSAGPVDGVGLLLIAIGLASSEDWFESSRIVGFSISAAVSLVAAAIWEWNHEYPIMDIRLFRDRSFAMCNILLLLFGLAHFAALVLLPQFLQTIMHYSATDAGRVLSPGGGRQDATSSVADALHWGVLTLRPLTVHEIDAGHFFVDTHRSRVLERVGDALEAPHGSGHASGDVTARTVRDRRAPGRSCSASSGAPGIARPARPRATSARPQTCARGSNALPAPPAGDAGAQPWVVATATVERKNRLKTTLLSGAKGDRTLLRRALKTLETT